MLKSGRYLQPERNRRYADFWSQRSNQCWAALLVIIISTMATVGVLYLIINGIKSKATYTGDMLLRVFPKSERDKIFLQKFDTLNIDAQVWGLPVNHDVPVYIYAQAGSMHRLEKTLIGRNLTYNILIQNMQKLIDREERTVVERQSHRSSESFDFENYHPYEEIIVWLEELSNTSRLVNISSMGKSHEKHSLLLVTISNSNGENSDNFHQHSHGDENNLESDLQSHSQNDKPVIYINCGIHAREWVAISSCLWMINKLANGNPADTSQLLDTYDFWFVPVANPDGYIYSWTTDRLWRKNRKPGYRCYGVDLNRNFDVGFNSTSRISCSSGYGGLEPDSEEETKAMIKLLGSNRHRVKAALFLHSFSQLWLSPYGVNNTNPKEYPEMERVMSKAVAALKTTYGTDYKYGSIANVLYSAPGTAIDYCYEKLGIIHSFVVELRDQGTNAFMLPIEEIKPTAIETWNGIIAMALAIKEKLH